MGCNFSLDAAALLSIYAKVVHLRKVEILGAVVDPDGNISREDKGPDVGLPGPRGLRRTL